MATAIVYGLETNPCPKNGVGHTERCSHPIGVHAKASFGCSVADVGAGGLVTCPCTWWPERADDAREFELIVLAGQDWPLAEG